MKLLQVVHSRLATFIILTLSFCPRSYSQAPQMRFSEIVDEARIIFTGTAAHKSCRWNANGTLIMTDVTFTNVSRVATDGNSVQAAEDRIVVTYAGGTVGGKGVTVCGQPNFEIGRKYFLFMLSDTVVYINPLVGAAQGMFEILTDTRNGKEYVLTAGRRGVLKIESSGLTATAAPVVEVSGGRSLLAPGHTTFQDAGSAETTTDAGTYGTTVSPMTLDEFMEQVVRLKAELPHTASPPARQRRGVFLQRNGVSGKIDSLPLPQSDALKPLALPERLVLPRHEEEAQPAIQGPGSVSTQDVGAVGILGGQLGACGYQTAPINFEMVPRNWETYPSFETAISSWGKIMNNIGHVSSDGYWPNNGQNEFAGWLDDATLQSQYNASWGNALALCFSWQEGDCARITESDIVLRGDRNWTQDFNLALGDPSVINLLPPLMHEMGHAWGYQRGTYAETYDYDLPSSMHPYYSHIVEDGRGLHVPDVYLLRKQYASQSSIADLGDVGVESYYASNGLHNSTTSKLEYSAGDVMVIKNITVEDNTWTGASVERIIIRFFLSFDREISPEDYELPIAFGDSVLAVRSEQYFVRNFTVRIPLHVRQGEYFVCVRVTKMDGSFERPYTDNNSTSLFEPINVNQVETWITVDQPAVDFGAVQIGGLSTRDIVVNNPSRLEVKILRSSLTTGNTSDFLLTTSGVVTLAPSSHATIKVAFRPRSLGQKSTRLRLETTSTLTEIIDVPLFGNGTVNITEDMPAGLLSTGIEQNYPNPAVGSTEVRYTLSRDGQARLTISDLLGREISTLVDSYSTRGVHTARIDADTLPPGTYLCSLTVDGKDRHMKILVIAGS